MYDVRSIESGSLEHCTGDRARSIICSSQLAAITAAAAQPLPLPLPNTTQTTTATITKSALYPSSVASQLNATVATASCASPPNSSSNSYSDMMSARRRRAFQRQACILSVMAAFSLGLALGVFVPIMGMSSSYAATSTASALRSPETDAVIVNTSTFTTAQNNDDEGGGSVSFVRDDSARLFRVDEVFRHAFHLEQQPDRDDNMIVKKLDPTDGSIREFVVQRTVDGLYRKSVETRLSPPASASPLSPSATAHHHSPDVAFVGGGGGNGRRSGAESTGGDQMPYGIVRDNIYWGAVVERALPQGFDATQTAEWTHYVATAGEVERLEMGCGRMQNRLVIFRDGRRACARYRQNTDQIQGELFSFYLGRLLNLTNLAPSTASIIDLESHVWSAATPDVTSAQWKSARPVVLTKWVPDLDAAGIPQPFRPLERHLNKNDVHNMTADVAATVHASRRPIGSLNSATTVAPAPSLLSPTNVSAAKLAHLVELAQWSDLIVFDYLIANLDRVVNNLYNFQWNADIMAAPAHNLAKQSATQLLVFLDNESGLLHGYRLLKKYEAYHGLLLDNLCMFREPTIVALRRLREQSVGAQLQAVFERSTTLKVRDVLPSLPDKSIKILIDRIDRVLGQVQKCTELFGGSALAPNDSRTSS